MYIYTYLYIIYVLYICPKYVCHYSSDKSDQLPYIVGKSKICVTVRN